MSGKAALAAISFPLAILAASSGALGWALHDWSAPPSALAQAPTPSRTKAPKPRPTVSAVAPQLDDQRPAEEAASGCSGRVPPDRGDFAGHVALTFDDGPNVETTPAIMATLREYQAPATFFLNGDQITSEEHETLVRELVADPLFDVGSHGWSHANLARADGETLLAEIDRNQAVLASLGASASFFRFPFGRATCDATALVRSKGMEVAGWHVSSADWCFSERDGWCRSWRYRYVPTHLRRDMVGFVLRQVRRRNGGIVLLHDRLTFTAEHLGKLLETLADEGFVLTKLADSRAFPRLNVRRVGS